LTCFPSTKVQILTQKTLLKLLIQEKAELEKSLYDHEVVCDIMAKRVEEAIEQRIGAIESGGHQGKTLVPRENQPSRPVPSSPNTQDLQGLELCMQQSSVGTFQSSMNARYGTWR
jgi:hypothetical protein